MAIVNYVREHIRFIEYASDEHLTAGERLLWYALMHIMNQRAQGNIWPEEYIRISNDRLVSLCPMKYDTIVAARNGLKQKGLIDFLPGEGKKNGKGAKSPCYRMNYFYPEYPAERPEKSDDMGGDRGYDRGCDRGYDRGYDRGCDRGDIYINYTKDNVYQKENYDEGDIQQESTRAREREAVDAWRKHIGGYAPKGAVTILREEAEMGQLGPGMIDYALEQAKGSRNPMRYAATVLFNWRMKHIRTLEDAHEYEDIYEREQGKEGYSAQISAHEEMDEFLARMKGES